MLLTLTTTHSPATDLGYLLHKNPARAHEFSLSFGRAHVFYPEATAERCTAALLVEIDPVGLVRTRRGPSGEGGLLDQYVNDRPYAASSFLSVALAQVLGSALGGRSKDRPELASQAIPLQATIPAVPCRGGADFLRRLFEPLGYAVSARQHPLDTHFPEWGEGHCFRVELAATLPLHELLGHLYVLLPVLDNDKHYWVGDDEVAKLLRHGEGWLARHPERDLITRRYLKHRRTLVDEALEQLADESRLHPDELAAAQAREEAKLEASVEVGAAAGAAIPQAETPAEETEVPAPSLHQLRLGTVLAVLKSSGAESVLDLGCGEGRLLRLLQKERQFQRILGIDVSHRSLEIAAENLHYDRMPAAQRERLRILHGSLMYRDARLSGSDAAAVVEVIEHLDPPRLAAFERVLFEFARPRVVAITTPNREYNVHWPTLPAGEFRHRDHRFEWTRPEFQAWAHGVAGRFGYAVRFLDIGPVEDGIGAPTQMGIFERASTGPTPSAA